VADGQGIVGDGPHGKHLLISFAGPPGHSEIVGEVRADELVPRDSGGLDGGIIDVSDLSRSANRNQWVQAGFDEAPGVLGSSAGLLIGTLAFGNVPSDRRGADHVTLSIVNGRDAERDGDRDAVFSHPDGFIVLHLYASPDLVEDLDHLVGTLGVDEKRNWLPDNLSSGVTVDLLSGGVPTRYSPVQILAHDRIV